MVGAMVTRWQAEDAPQSRRAVDIPAMPRVRFHHPGIASLIERAAERSKTFRGLVEAIDASNGIVYVEEGQCGRHVVKSCVAAVTQTIVRELGAREWPLSQSGPELVDP